MAEVVYALCAVLATLCAARLFQAYRRHRANLLLWSSLSFMLMALNNIILFIDLVILPATDFGGSVLRSTLGAASGAVLLYGLIWEGT